MDPSPRPNPAAVPLAGAAGIQITVDDPAWRRSIPRAEAIARRAARLLIGSVSVVLTSNRAVRRLNAAHRGRNAPTNVLTYEPALPGLPGEIFLARETVLREARAAGKRPADHLAHLVVQGIFHLAGHDHDHAGDARRMERAETRVLHRLRRPDPWRPRRPVAWRLV
jgi:probable rRNA maturation factor